MTVHIPALADAITMLVARGQIELFLGERGGEEGLVSLADVPDTVTDPNNWWSPVEGTTPETALLLTPEVSSVPLPQRRPEATGAQQ